MIVTTLPERCDRITGSTDRVDVQRTEEVRLQLRPELGVTDLLEEPGVEVPGIIDQDVDPPEPRHGSIDRRLRGSRIGDIQRHGQQVVLLAKCCGDLGGIPSRGDHEAAGLQGGPHQVDPHATGGAGDQPHRTGGVSHENSAFRWSDVTQSRRRPAPEAVPGYRVNDRHSLDRLWRPRFEPWTTGTTSASS
ncbi:MAG TPA: hypothetical protein VM429_14845 [Micropruina sp.]|nr:hypothetical protein [Micropruina sp.]